MTFKYRLSSWVLFALAARMYGADPTGAISGTVLDPSGAAVTKVRITATNTGASLNRETLSAVEGGFIFPLPPVGPYALAMEAPGFRSFEQRGTTVSANVNVTIPVVLQFGETTENGNGGSARGPARNAFRHTGTGGESAVTDPREWGKR